MIQKTRFSQLIVGVLLVGFFLTLSAPAYAGRGGFGGGGMGMSGGGMGMSGGGMGMSGGGFHGGMGMGGSGFRGGRGGFASSGFHGGRSFHGHGFHGHRCCVNGVFFTGFAFGGFPAPYYYYPYPDYWYPPYPYMPYPYAPYVPDLNVSLPVAQASPSLDLSASVPRESCFASGCYYLRGDGVTVPYQWIWVPAPPPPPAVIPYPSGRYELRGPSRWEWVPNNASAPSSVLPASSRTIDTAPANLSVRGLYHWTDESGVTHWTQGLEGVPERYRPKADSGVSKGGSTL
jgi:hypothetical protein